MTSTRATATFVLLLLAIGSNPSVAQEQTDDTAAILALTELGGQMQLNQGRVIGLTLEGDEIDDEAMRQLEGLGRLQSLTLKNTRVTGEGLKHLQELTLLGAISIYYTPLSDRDIDELVALKSVVNYTLHGTKISGMGKQRMDDKLAQARRDATVVLHFGGFLGVTGSLGEERCLLSLVMPDSAAAKAGMQVGDIIVKFDGRDVEDFPALARAVRLTPPEQAVPVKIERGGQIMSLNVTLQRRPP